MRLSDGSVVTGSPKSLSSGVITLGFSPREVSSLRITVDSVFNPLDHDPPSRHR